MKYIKINCVNLLDLIFKKLSWYFEEINGNKYLTPVPTNEIKKKRKYYEERYSKIRDLTASITKNSDDYDEKYRKVIFNSDDELPLNKKIEISSMKINFRAIFYKKNKYYSETFFDEILHKINKWRAKINFKKLILKVVRLVILMK